MSLLTLIKDRGKAEGNISHYQAIAAVLAGNFGTGNISGMAVALSMGGPGALIFMWVMVFFGAIIQYASCLLAVKYRTKAANDEFVGGPMYYLLAGLGLKKGAMFFSFLVIVAAIAVGGFVQTNSLALPLKEVGVNPWISGLVLAAGVGLVIFGGIRRVAKLSAAIVPVMALLYFGAAVAILFLQFDKMPEALSLIIKSLGSGKSVLGGVTGFALTKAIASGFDRAIFAADIGTGSVPILQAGAKTTHPVIDGVVSLIAPFFVMLVCTATGLVLIVTGTWNADLESTNMITAAFTKGLGSHVGATLVFVSLILFAYTTMITWASCGAKGAQFLFGKKGEKAFQILYILLIPFGATLKVGFVWAFADAALTLMLFINILAIALLSKEVVADTNKFFAHKIDPSLE